MPMKIIPFDGPSIISNIKEYKPELLRLLTDFEDKLTSNTDFDPSNIELLSALKSNITPHLNDFYSDLSFFVGSFESNLLLHLDIHFKDDKLEIAEENWSSSKKELEEIIDKYGIRLIDESISEIEERFSKNKRDYESKQNKRIKKICCELDEQIQDFNIRITAGHKALATSLDASINPLANKLSNDELSKRLDAISYLRKTETNQTNEIIKKFNIKGNPFYEEVDGILSLIYERNKFISELADYKSKIIKEPYYKLKINTQALLASLQHFKLKYFEDIKLINKRKLTSSGLRNFLYQTQKTLSLVSKLRSDSFFLSKFISFKTSIDHQDRVSISPHDIFSTGHDIAVYGGAGVGKTTTLIAYADTISVNGNHNLIYIALNRLVDEYKKISLSIDKESLNRDLLIRLVLLSKGMSPTNENIESARKIISNNLTLILDGLDEVYNTIPNIIPAISAFKINNPKAQLIVSSRDCVSYLDNIDFLGITLLPFTEEQLNRFIRGWIKDIKKADALIESIKNRELFEHIKTPLLATITCSLVEKGINAPSTENEIYSERLRLLTGEYDLHKNIERQKQQGELLRKCAIKIAYYMHTKGIRSLSKNEMLKALHESLFENYTKELLAECLEELINPCNLIIIDPITSTYSFGHFRFQEHLASEELKSNRSIDLPELAINDWWRGVLGLYSQDNDISRLFEEIYNRYGNLNKAKITLELMIINSPQQKRNGLKSLLTEYLRSDKLDSLFLNSDSDYFDDNDYYYNGGYN
jgi:flagellar biosynthesis GTPase FlhF